MIREDEQQTFIEFVNKIGYDIGEAMMENIEVHYHKSFSFLPDLAMFIAFYTVKKSFSRHTVPPKYIKNNIRFFFHNVFDYGTPDKGKNRLKPQESPPYVRMFPSALPHTSFFKKNAQVKVVSVIVNAGYLKSFLDTDASRFQFLFDTDNNFLIEELMTEDIIRTVDEILNAKEPEMLKSYHYKLKVMELLFYLFQSLGKRESSVHQKLTDTEIKAIYRVRDKLISSLQKPAAIAELKQLAGMNELKMRKIFMQVFGMGIYEYYQHLRMKEAARLLREEKRTVSEAGYAMGFENLSHFSRVFEKHIGKKPKKYSTGL